MDPTKDENCKVHYLASDLPQPLPTLEEINESRASFITECDSNKVTIIGENYIVKRGSFDIMEGWTMVYLKKMTSIPIPTVYAILTDVTDKKAERTIIVMEYIRGPTLKDAWKDMDVSQKEDISKQLATHFAELRALPSLGVFGRSLPPEFGNLPNRHLLDFVFRGNDGNTETFGGPFETVAQLGKGLGDSMLASLGHFIERAKIYNGFIPKILTEGPPVFTHGDVHLGNVVLRDGKVVIIDWGLCGWYPACWEFSYAMYAADHETDFGAYIPKFLDEYPSECLLIMVLRNMQFGGIM